MSSRPVRLYRITHIENLRTILKEGGIWCGNEMVRRNLRYTSIGNKDLTNSRSNRRVRCCQGGNLNDYVPFYFCPRSVMLYLIFRSHDSTYGGGQEPVIHLEATLPAIQRRNLPCFFTDRHAFTVVAQQLDDLSLLSELDWATLQSNTWNNTLEDPDRQERKMAEFLVHRFVPWECIVRIGVFNKRYQREAEAILSEFGDATPVEVRTGWYY